MTIRWRHSAIADLAAIRDHIALDSPRSALAVTEAVLRAVDRLESFPNSGRPGLVLGTRELVVPGLPLVVVYIVVADDTDIIAVFHGAQDREHSEKSKLSP